MDFERLRDEKYAFDQLNSLRVSTLLDIREVYTSYAGEPVINYHRFEAVRKTISKNSDLGGHASKRDLIAAKLYDDSRIFTVIRCAQLAS